MYHIQCPKCKETWKLTPIDWNEYCTLYRCEACKKEFCEDYTIKAGFKLVKHWKKENINE